MAREKCEPRKAPSALSDAYRDIPRYLANRADTPAGQQALLNGSNPWEMPIPTNWNAARVKEGKKSHRQRDLEKVQRIVDARLKGLPVTERELEWAINVGEVEEEMEDEENNRTGTGSVFDDRIMWDDDDMDQQSDTGSTMSMPRSTTDKTGAGNTVADMDSDSSSRLSEISDVPALNPDNSPEKPQIKTQSRLEKAPSSKAISKAPTKPIKKAPAQRAKKKPVSRKGKKEEGEATEEEKPNPEKAALQRALTTLKYDTNPPDRPHWVTGLNEPLPHPSLTTLQNHEVSTRFWHDDLTRLETLRCKLPIPSPGGEKGEWHYEHYGSTQEVRLRNDGYKRKSTFARGVWMWVVGGEVRERRLDEYPVSVEGEPVGWRVEGGVRG